LTLVDNGTDQLVVQNNGNYSFSTKISSGGVYKVTIGAQPNGQTCSLSNGTGSGSGITADVTDISVVCSNITYTVGGSLSGLASGTQVTLLNNGADSLTLTGNGPFSFATPIAYNGSYSVTIGSQPNGRSCSITGNSGAGAGVTSNIQTVIVVCSPPPYTFTPSTARTSFVAGYPVSISMTAKQTVAFSGLVYLSITADAAVVNSPITVTPNPDGSFSVTAMPLASLPVGHYNGNFTVYACTDVNCNSLLAGSPFNVPYDITAISPNGSVTLYNLSALAPLSGAPDWGTYQGNAAHTGFVPVTLNASAFNARWVWDAPSYSGVQWSPSALTTGAGMFYVASGPNWNGSASGHELFSYKEADGSQVWSHSFADLAFPNTNPPAFSGSTVFIAAGSQNSTYMFAFDAASGTQVFKAQMASQWEHYFAPTIANGLVYSDGGTYGGMFAFDATTGVQQFFATAGQYDGWTPAVDATNAYAYTGGSLGIYDNRTGALLGSIGDPTYSWNGYTTNGAPVLGGANIVYAGNLSNRTSNSIVSFDTLSMAVRWSIRGAYSGNPAYSGGTLFASNNSPFALEAYNEADGGKLWTWTPIAGDSNFVSDVLVTNNLVFVSTDANTYAIDRSTHLSVWSYPATGSLALSANGVLYIKSTNSIVAINLH
jgi:hypothetical protein